MHLQADVLAPVAADFRPAPGESASAMTEQLLADILADAFHRGASKVHLEPRGGGSLAVRLRLAGALTEVLRLPADRARGLIDRVLAGPLRFDGREVGVAALSTAEGERVVLHLGPSVERIDELAALGMRPRLVTALSATLARAGGLVLVAGPPRSGVTTTLHTLLRRVDAGSRGVLRVGEGPAMAEELRAVLRQDPDVILVERIADRATAMAAIEAAQTGHLVLAGVAVGDAIGAVLRLRELRVEPFQLASTLQVVVAQRLVRRLCGECRQPVQATRSVSALLGFDAGAVVYVPTGCDACGGTGFQGETGVFEAIQVDAGLRRLINDGGDCAILARHAFLNSPNLGSAARKMVREGLTTPEEAIRVARG